VCRLLGQASRMMSRILAAGIIKMIARKAGTIYI
jgi:hypothetical protein